MAVSSVLVAPWLQRHLGTIAGILLALGGFAATLLVMAVWTENKTVLIVCVVVAGIFLGVNNTLITETVMESSTVERSTASAAYSFVRFSGGAAAPFIAGILGERINDHVPFFVGAAAVAAAAVLLLSQRRRFGHLDAEVAAETPAEEAAAVGVGDMS